jgi:predicted nucleic acid-binding protein
MIIVIDTNIIISAILNPQGVIGLRIIYPSDKVIFLAPEYVKKEIWKHKDRIKKIGNFTEPDFEEILFVLFGRINFYSEDIFSEYIKNHANGIMKDGDTKDIPFVSMALFFQVKIWTGDLKLKKYLVSRGMDICININDF